MNMNKIWKWKHGTEKRSLIFTFAILKKKKNHMKALCLLSFHSDLCKS